MKNLNYLLNFFLFLCFTTLFSCQKATEEPLGALQESTMENAQEPWRSTEIISTRSDGYGYIDQEHLNIVTYQNGLMEFPSYQAMADYVDYLDSLTEVHNDAFYSLYGDMTDDALDSLELQLNFHEDQPLLDFEDYFQFPSLRKKIASEVDVWLQDPNPDFDNSPEDHPIIDEATRALTNESGRLKIGAEIVDLGRNWVCDATERDCCAFGRTKRDFIYTFGGKERRMRLIISLRQYPPSLNPAYAEVKGKTISYKRGGPFGWKRDRTKIYVSITGQVRSIDCNLRNTFFKDRP